jgi:hypothetical protein
LVHLALQGAQLQGKGAALAVNLRGKVLKFDPECSIAGEGYPPWPLISGGRCSNLVHLALQGAHFQGKGAALAVNLRGKVLKFGSSSTSGQQH